MTDQSMSAPDFLLGPNGDHTMDATRLLGHDLKSPVAIVIGALEISISMHEGDPAMEPTVRLLRGALMAAKRELAMISDMLDLARLRHGHYELQPVHIDLGDLVREALMEEDEALHIKQLRVELALDEPLMAVVDEYLFRRTVSTLIDNVIKFTVAGDLLRIEGQNLDGGVEIVFIDNGRPILPGYERRLLDEVSQWESREEGSRTSVGLGIPFVAAVVRAHGGVMTAQSDDATGLTRLVMRYNR